MKGQKLSCMYLVHHESVCVFIVISVIIVG